MMLRVGVIGATGYTALELFRILLRHPQVRVTRATSRSDSGTRLDSVHAGLRGQFDLTLTDFNIDDFTAHVDVAFCCLPHAAASPVVKQLLDAGIRTIDFSADYRLDSAAEFETIYHAPHADAERVGQIPYGLPELFAENIRQAPAVANPGCFPTSVILPLAPLLRSELIEINDIIVDSKTGVSGGGRTPKLGFHFPECNESVSAYGVGTHRHRPEMETILRRATGISPSIIFTPHLIPMDRGILSTIYVRPKTGIGVDTVVQLWRGTFANAPFVRISDALPATKDVAGTNYCDLAVRAVGARLVIVSAIDNLIKGASGAAVQNFNLMCGFPETTALF